MIDPDELRRAEEAYNRALYELPKLGSSQTVSKRNGVENNYGQAYQRLVRLGVAPQLRAKYRRKG